MHALLLTSLLAVTPTEPLPLKGATLTFEIHAAPFANFIYGLNAITGLTVSSSDAFREAWSVNRILLPADEKVLEQWSALANRYPSYVDFAEAIPELLTRLSQPPTTLIHGDFRLDNLFFRADGLTVIDWQLISRGRAAYDLAYFMSQSLPPEQRARLEIEELRRYHARLAEGGVRSYSFDECFNDYRLATLACLMYPFAAGGGIDLGNERGVALATAFATRSFAAVEHLNAGGLMPA